MGQGFGGTPGGLGLVGGAHGEGGSSGSRYCAGLFTAVSRAVKCPEIQKLWRGGMLSSNEALACPQSNWARHRVSTLGCFAAACWAAGSRAALPSFPHRPGTSIALRCSPCKPSCRSRPRRGLARAVREEPGLHVLEVLPVAIRSLEHPCVQGGCPSLFARLDFSSEEQREK